MSIYSKLNFFYLRDVEIFLLVFMVDDVVFDDVDILREVDVEGCTEVDVERDVDVVVRGFTVDVDAVLVVVLRTAVEVIFVVEVFREVDVDGCTVVVVLREVDIAGCAVVVDAAVERGVVDVTVRLLVVALAAVDVEGRSTLLLLVLTLPG